MSAPSFPQELLLLLFSATNAPHSIWVTVTSTFSFFRDSWTTRAVATNSGYWGEHLSSILKPPLGYPASARSFLAPSTSALRYGRDWGSRNQSPYPVGTGPDGTAAPKAAFWMTSLVSTAI